MLAKVKEDLFTLHGLITTAIHLCFLVGVVTTVMLFQTEVMGVDPTNAVTSVTNLTKRK